MAFIEEPRKKSHPPDLFSGKPDLKNHYISTCIIRFITIFLYPQIPIHFSKIGLFS